MKFLMISYDNCFLFFLRNNKIITSRVGGIFRVGQVTPVQLFFVVA